jgi:hypothetical protein
LGKKYLYVISSLGLFPRVTLLASGFEFVITSLPSKEKEPFPEYKTADVRRRRRAVPSRHSFPFRMLLLSVRGVHSHFVELGNPTTEIPLLSWICKSKVQQKKLGGVL